MIDDSCEFTNKCFRYSISPELYKLRDDFCKVKGSIKCDTKCPIYSKYFSTGLSCNGALDKFPDECRAMMITNNNLVEKGGA